MPSNSVNARVADDLRVYSLDLVALENRLNYDVRSILKGIESSTVAELVKTDPTGSDVGSVRVRRLKALLLSVRAIVNREFTGIEKVTSTELGRLISFESKRLVGAINDIISVDIVSVAITPAKAASLVKEVLIDGAPNRDWWLGNPEMGKIGQSQLLIDRFAKEMRTGVMSGESLSQLVQRVRGTKANAYKDGIMSTSYAQAEALVRTSVIHASNTANLETMKENEDVIKGWTWVATLDDRTCIRCQALDGLSWDLTYKPVGHKMKFPGPTVHIRCRCTQAPLIKSFNELRAEKGLKPIKGLDSWNEATRASMDGEVPQAMKFEEWLSSKPESFQLEVLGPSRYKLWKSGKLTIRQMVQSNTELKTVAQLQKEYGSR